MQGELKKSDVSILNWMGTQLLLLIPGVNLIMLIVWMITGRSRSKRNYCIAALIWLVIAVVLCVVALAFFGNEINAWVAGLNGAAPQAIVPTIAPTATPLA